MEKYKFYRDDPEVTRIVKYTTISGEIIEVVSEQNPFGYNQKILTGDGDELPPNTVVIKIQNIDPSFEKNIHKISEYDDMKYDLYYGFFCIEIDGVIYQTDFGNYGDKPDWATHFINLVQSEYARY